MESIVEKEDPVAALSCRKNKNHWSKIELGTNRSSICSDGCCNSMTNYITKTGLRKENSEVTANWGFGKNIYRSSPKHF